MRQRLTTGPRHDLRLLCTSKHVLKRCDNRKSCRRPVVPCKSALRDLLKILEPVGVEARSRHRFQRRHYKTAGPNHIDGYDKLKPFGFCIHGAIDGYSRRIMSLEAGPTNNMYLLTEWEGRTGKYLARGHGVRTERSEFRAP